MHELHVKCRTFLCTDWESFKRSWGCIEELNQWAYKSKFIELHTQVPRHICWCNLKSMCPVNEVCISHLVALIYTVILENGELVHAMYYINVLEKVENLWKPDWSSCTGLPSSVLTTIMYCRCWYAWMHFMSVMVPVTLELLSCSRVQPKAKHSLTNHASDVSSSCFLHSNNWHRPLISGAVGRGDDQSAWLLSLFLFQFSLWYCT